MKNILVKFIFLMSTAFSFSQCPEVLDVDGWAGFDTYPSGNDHWQSFTSVTTGKLTRVQISVTADPFNFTFSVYDGNGINGTLLYSDNYSLSGTGWLDVNIPMTLAPDVINGSQYTYRLESANSFTCYSQSGDPITGGVYYNDVDGLTLTDVDANFKTYVTVAPIGVVEEYNDVSCYGQSDGNISTTISSGQLPYTFLWLESGQTTQDAFDVGPGGHTLVITDFIGCVDTVFATIIEPNEIIFDAGVEQSICKGFGTILNAEEGGVNYVWNGPNISNISGQSISIIVDTTAYYLVEVTSDLGCISQDSVLISTIANSNCEISFSNTISCNNDGINDTWEIQGIESFPENKVTIFNRWGDVVYETDNYDNTMVVWKGENAFNEVATPGTYFYKIELVGGPSYSGWIVLLR